MPNTTVRLEEIIEERMKREGPAVVLSLHHTEFTRTWAKKIFHGKLGWFHVDEIHLDDLLRLMGNEAITYREARSKVSLELLEKLHAKIGSNAPVSFSDRNLYQFQYMTGILKPTHEMYAEIKHQVSTEQEFIHLRLGLGRR